MVNIACFLQVLILMNIASNDEYRLFPSGICTVVIMASNVCFLQVLILMNIASNDEYRLFPSDIDTDEYSE